MIGPDRRWRLVGGVLQFVVVPLLGAASVTWWLVGDISERGGEDVMFEIPFAQRNAAWLGTLGVALVVLVLAAVYKRRPEGRRRAWQCAAFSASAGCLAAAGLRVMTAKVGGANIGGGLAMLVSPFVLVPLVGFALARARQLWKTVDDERALASAVLGEAEVDGGGRRVGPA